MCGPLECLPCRTGFLTRLLKERQLQVWTALWVPLIIFWFIFYGVQIDKLVSSEGDNSFQVILKKQDSIPLPAWTICSDTNSEIVQIQCQKDNGPLLVPNKYNDSCFGFNERSPALEATPGKGNIDCVIGFKGNEQSGIVFLHDSIYSADIHDPKNGGIIYDFLKQVPSGICATDIRQGQKTFFWWRWNRFEFMGGDGTINAYEEVSSSVINHVSPQYNHSGTLRLEVGDYYQWRYYEVQWWSGYDFWYFVGLIGGVSFLLLLIHAVLYYPIQSLYARPVEYLNLDDQESGATATERPLTEIRSGAASSSGSSNPAHDTL